MGVGALCVKGSCWWSRFKLTLERAGVSPTIHIDQSHQQFCQLYHIRDGYLDHNSCRICRLCCFPCMPRVRIASRSWHLSMGGTAHVYGVDSGAGVGQS